MSLRRPLLLPFVPLYRLALAVHERRFASGRELARKLHWPVISIGNLSTGGTGKTPLTILLARALSERGIRTDILSRGYGRSAAAPARVHPDGSAREFGDEPLLMARATGVPVYVAAERFRAGILAETEAGENTAGVHILDDGFQHRQLWRDVNILLLNREDWHDWLLPAGNLREPILAAARANVLVLPAEDAELENALRNRGWTGPVWHMARRMHLPQIAGPAVAFCGIARPGQFFSGLETAGLPLAARIAFRDHHVYTERDVTTLRQAAQSAGATLVTTEKDLARLGPLAASLPLKTVPLRIEIEDQDTVLNWLIERLKLPQSKAAL